MEYERIHRLVNGGEQMPDLVSKFTSKKLVQVYDQTPLNGYRENKEICFKTAMLRSDLCDYSDAFVEVSTNIVVTVNRVDADNTNVFANIGGVAVDNTDKRTFTLKNNAPFVSCITKINGELIENAEDLDVVMPMYNLIEYSKNFRKTNGSLHNYYRDQPNSGANNGIIYSVKDSASYKYKPKITERFPNFVEAAVGESNELALAAVAVKIIIPLKHLGNFWHELNMPLINCEIELKLKWNKNCVLVNKATRAAAGAAFQINTPTAASLDVSDCKLYVSVVTLRAVDENKLLNNLKIGFKRIK